MAKKNDNSNFNFSFMNKETLTEMLSEILSEKLSQLLFASEPERIKTLLEILMKAERELHLENSENDKGNGYRQRKLNTSYGQIDLNIPRDRDGDFYPSVLPSKYQRFDQSYLDLLKAGLNNFYSQSTIKNYLNNLNLPYSQKELKKLSEKMYEEYKIWQQRELPKDVIALFIDGFHTELYDEEENKVMKAVVYTVIGIDFRGNKDLYSVEFLKGNENKEGWLMVLNNLIKRGLRRVLVVVSDDFKGLDEAVKTLYPKSFHQLCWTHFRRNIRKNMGKEDAKIFSEEMEKLKLLDNFESAIRKFTEIIERFKNKYPAYISYIENKKELFLCFFRFDKSVRKHFYTTNIVESFNNILSTIEKNNGGYFRSKKALELSCYAKRNQLKSKKWKKTVPNIVGNIYYLTQMFASKYGELPVVD